MKQSKEASQTKHEAPGARCSTPAPSGSSRKRRSRSTRSSADWSGLLVATGMILFTGWSLRQVQAQGGDAAIARGKQVYAASKCAICHSVGGKGGNVGPALDDVGKRWTAEK